MSITVSELPLEHVVVAGDWHEHTAWAKLVMETVASRGHQAIIHVGDLGVIWPESDFDDVFTRTLVETANAHDLVFIFVDGNHDNHPGLRALPVNDEGFGVISDRILHAPRGHRWTMSGVRFGALGGAFSIDRDQRELGWSWWVEETTPPEDVALLGTEPLDVLITHEVPAGIDVKSSFALPEGVERQAHANRLTILDGVRITDPALVFSGHWHQRVTGQLPYRRTVVHVLDREGEGGNVATLSLADLRVTDGILKPVTV